MSLVSVSHVAGYALSRGSTWKCKFKCIDTPWLECNRSPCRNKSLYIGVCSIWRVINYAVSHLQTSWGICCWEYRGLRHHQPMANALHGTALNAPIDHCRRAYAYVTNKQKYVCFFSDRVRAAAADGELEEQEEKTECVPFSRRRRRLLWGIMLDKPIAFRWLAGSLGDRHSWDASQLE